MFLLLWQSQNCVNNNYLPACSKRPCRAAQDSYSGLRLRWTIVWWVNEPLIAWRVSALPPLWRRNGTCYQLFQERLKLGVLIKPLPQLRCIPTSRLSYCLPTKRTVVWKQTVYHTHTHSLSPSLTHSLTQSSFSSDCIKYLVSLSDVPRINSTAATSGQSVQPDQLHQTAPSSSSPLTQTHRRPFNVNVYQRTGGGGGGVPDLDSARLQIKKHSIWMNSPLVGQCILFHSCTAVFGLYCLRGEIPVHWDDQNIQHQQHYKIQK